jgi:PAS domain S-box-containing protein
MRRPFIAYSVAAAGLLAALALRWVLDPVVGSSLPFVTMFGAVAAAVWVGGYQPAILVALLGYLGCNYLFIEPRGAFALKGVETAVGLVAYLFTCALVIAFGEAMRAAEFRATQRGELLQITLRSIGDAVITTDNHGRVTQLNPVAESLTGWGQAEALGQPLDAVFRIVNEATRQPVESPVRRALREGTVVGLANHTMLVRRDGTEIAIDDSAAPIRDERGLVSGCVLIFRDVTVQRTLEREKTTQLLTARRLAAIVESSDDAIVAKSLEGVIQSWNLAAERLFGYSAEEAVGRHISLVIPKERIAEEDQIIASLRAGRRIEHFETERVRKDGGRIFVSLTISPIKDEAGAVVGASKIVRDITDRKRAEADRETFVTVIENSTDFIGMCDLEGVPFFINRAGLAMVGLDGLEQARATPVREFFFPEDQPRMMGEFFPRVLEAGHGEIEVRFRHFKTGEPRWMAYKVLTLRDTAGKPVGFATVSQDVTERRRLEDDLRRLAADLSEADRKKDEFLAMLAHELRNPLAPLSYGVQTLRRAGTPADAVGATADMLERQVAQMARLVDDLLDMSRITQGKIELRTRRVELGPVLEQAVEAVRALHRSIGQELSIVLPQEPVTLDADPARLAQVVGNLLNNASKFTDKGGRIALTVEREGGHVAIRVRDTGIGISAENLPRVFDMFAQVDTSLERSRDGLGIGLTLVKTLVEMHGGTVEARSDGPGLGSEFVVRLPVLAEGPEGGPKETVSTAASRSRRRILIVDDNEDGAESLALLLTVSGHETHTVHDGLEGIAAIERLRPDLVLLDIGLPGLNGYEVCRRVRQQPWGRDLALVALTGWGQQEDRERSKAAGFTTHMVKPVDPDRLMRLVDSLPSGINAG